MITPKRRQRYKGSSILIATTLGASYNAFAAGPPQASELTNSLAIVLLVVMIVLLLAIGLLANVLTGAAQVYLERLKAEKDKVTATAVKAVSVMAFCLLTSVTFAADGPSDKGIQAVASTNFGGLSATSFYVMVGIIGIELLILLSLALHLRSFIIKDKPAKVAEEVVHKEPAVVRIWKKMNSFRDEHEVHDTGHNYDGIRELDNKLPPWWLYGFYACILFSFIYVYRFHVSHSAPSSIEEYEMAMAKADVEKEEYLKTAASKVDENSVALITDPASLIEGQKLFGANCAACHGAEGQGVVGPNLTDDYWLHKGGLKDVFKIIKYGVQEKGMKSWKDDFSPVQIAKLASYIKSLHGTKPAGAKDPQGELFTDENKGAPDSIRTAKKDVAVK